jgi:prefoldin subunit 5
MKMTDMVIEILKRRIKELEEELKKKDAQIEELKSKIDRLLDH